MRLALFAVPAWLATLVFWLLFPACIDDGLPDADAAAIARVVVVWDPLACGEPHRVAVELEDHAGIEVSASTPCAAGSLTIDVLHFGVYYGRVYGAAITPVRLFVDEVVVHWMIATP